MILCMLVLWTAMFTILTLQDGVTTAAVGEGLSKWIIDFLGLDMDPVTLHLWMRSAAHFVGFFVEVILIYNVVDYDHPVLAALAICILLAVVSEAIKLPIDGRHFSWIDVGKNIAGSAAGAGVIWIIRKWRSAGK